MSMPTYGANGRREANKDLAQRWVGGVAAHLSDEEYTKALADLVCWIVLIRGQIALVHLIKELGRRM